jgi:hypothetical protein
MLYSIASRQRLALMGLATFSTVEGEKGIGFKSLNSPGLRTVEPDISMTYREV